MLSSVEHGNSFITSGPRKSRPLGFCIGLILLFLCSLYFSYPVSCLGQNVLNLIILVIMDKYGQVICIIEYPCEDQLGLFFVFFPPFRHLVLLLIFPRRLNEKNSIAGPSWHSLKICCPVWHSL